METWIIILIIVIVLLVVGGVTGFLVYWFVFRTGAKKTSKPVTSSDPITPITPTDPSVPITPITPTDPSIPITPITPSPSPSPSDNIVRYGDVIRLFNNTPSSNGTGYLYQCGTGNNICGQNVATLHPTRKFSNENSPKWIIKSNTKQDGEQVMTQDEIEIISFLDNSKLKLCQTVNNNDTPCGFNVGSSLNNNDQSSVVKWSIITRTYSIGQRPPVPIGVTKNKNFLIINRGSPLQLLLDTCGSSGVCGLNVTLNNAQRITNNWQVRNLL